MQHCLKLTLQCPVSQTAFFVGSCLFLPDTSPHFTALRPFFPSFPFDDPDPVGLIIGDGYSRQIPGNTHAEANALANFRTRYAELAKTETLPPAEDVLKDTDCYATMEPCSVRTSGGPSCALELARAKVRAVFLVSSKVLAYMMNTDRDRVSRSHQTLCNAKESGSCKMLEWRSRG